MQLYLPDSAFDYCINLPANSLKFFFNLPVAETQHFYSMRLQPPGAFRVIFRLLRFVVLHAIQFNHKFCLWAIKVHNVSAKDALAAKMHRVSAKIIKPEMVFLRRCLSAQALRPFGHAVVMGHVVSSLHSTG